MRTPFMIPPARSPPEKAVVIDSAASAHARSDSRRADSLPVTTSSCRSPGATTTSTARGASGPSAACSRSAWSRMSPSIGPT
jgi:hypothetical protein